jgi:hypothetical protein
MLCDSFWYPCRLNMEERKDREISKLEDEGGFDDDDIDDH